MMTEPEQYMEIMQWIGDAYIVLCRHFSKIARLPVTEVHVGECSSCMVSPEMIEQGRIVAVIKDRVRVRKSPIDGEILGLISSGNRVLLVEEVDGWCHVKTRRGNEGWMVCWALAL